MTTLPKEIVGLSMGLIKQMTIMGRDIEFNPASIVSSPPAEDRYPDVCSLALDVSGRCNLRCSYCAETMTLPKRVPMTREMLTLAVESLFNWSRPDAHLSLHFGSGEPLLQADLIQQIGHVARRRARKEHRNLSLHLTTNGTLLKKRMIKWLASDEWEVKISLDGPRANHDRFRTDGAQRGTYDKVKRRVRRLAQKIPERFSTTAVLCEGSDPAAVFAKTKALGVHFTEMVPVAAALGSPLLPGAAELGAYRLFILNYVKKLEKEEELPELTRLQTQLRRVLGIGNKQIACGAGRTFFAVDQQGELYPCYRFLGLQRFVVGNIINGPNTDKIKQFTSDCGKPLSSRRQCIQCWASTLCDGPCFAVAELFGQGNPSEEFCSMIRADSEAALWLVDKLRTTAPVRLCQLAGIKL